MGAPRDLQGKRSNAEAATSLRLDLHPGQEKAPFHTTPECDPITPVCHKMAEAHREGERRAERGSRVTCDVDAAKVQLAFQWHRVEYFECCFNLLSVVPLRVSTRATSPE
jgi:hypothetical protein